MSDKYRIGIKHGKMHLFKKEVLFDSDCGKLIETFTGKLETSNIFSENYTLEDISGMFSSGDKYRVVKSNGEEGIMTKIPFSDYYEYEKF